MSIVLGGVQYEVPGVTTVSYLDDPARVPMTTDVNHRRHPIQMICAHTELGLRRAQLLDGCLPQNDTAFDLARYQVRSGRSASWDFTVGSDGVVTWSNDPLVSYTWHATSINPRSIGFEMAQKPDGIIHACQIESASKMIVFLCQTLGIQAQTPVINGRPDEGIIERVKSGGANVVGVVGHRNVTEERGPGDPGNYIFDKLLSEKFAGFDFNSGEDLAYWRAEQARLNLPQTGVPLRAETEALLQEGKPYGMMFGPWTSYAWVPWVVGGTVLVLAVGGAAWYMANRKTTRSA